jgi:hypothetical protein
MWPFKKKCTVEEAYNKILPALYRGKHVLSIKHHGKGSGPQSLGQQPDCFLVTTEDGKFMLSESEKVELK